MRAHTLVFVALAAAASGCDASSNAPAAPSSAAPAASATAAAAGMLTSVFTIVSYTRNEESCDKEGPSILSKLGDHRFVYAFEHGDGPGSSLMTCETVEACRAKAIAWRERKETPQGKLMAPFAEVVDPTHRRGFLIDTGFTLRKSACRQAKSTKTELRLRGDELTFTLRGAQGDIDLDEKGRCTTKRAEEILSGRPCNYYLVLKAELAGAL